LRFKKQLAEAEVKHTHTQDMHTIEIRPVSNLWGSMQPIQITIKAVGGRERKRGRGRRCGKFSKSRGRLALGPDQYTYIK
jgi:hypothetical protein